MLSPQWLRESKISKVEHLLFLEGPLETQDVQMRHFFVFLKRNYGYCFPFLHPWAGLMTLRKKKNEPLLAFFLKK